MAQMWLDTTEAARRLGVKPASLYAYVSRGQLRRRTAPDGRRSEYHPADVATLAVRGRRSRPAKPSDVIVPTAITAITPDGPAYRGRLATALAGTVGFEQVAADLWGVEAEGPWQAPPEVLAAVGRARPAADGRLDAGQLLMTATVAARAADPLGRDLRQPVVAGTARSLLMAFVAALGGHGQPATSLAEALTVALCADPDTDRVRAVDAALVLLADHELAASTLAARVAASARCDPYAVELAGLAVVSGPRHGAASRQLEAALRDVEAGEEPSLALAGQLRAEEAAGGFGHPLYPDGDPRGRRLIEVMAQGRLADRLDPLHRMLETAAARGLPAPNIDAALAGLTHAIGAPVGAGELLFAIARTAGWIAHALEQYADPQLLRPKAVYTGP